MNCQVFWDSMPELDREYEFEQPRHIQECAACSALWERQRALAAGLRSVAGARRQLRAPARVEARLVAAFRGEAAPPPMRWSRWWMPLMTWTSAAAATAALAFFLAHGRPAPVPQRSAPASVQQVIVQAAGDWVADDDSGSASDFIPLPNVPQIGPNEDTDIVRVEVPRSAMIAMGFAVRADRASDMVEADVMLGPDGLAHAVRFSDE